MTDTPQIVVNKNSTLINPLLAAVGVIISFGLGLMAKRGWIDGSDVATLSPAIGLIAVTAWRSWSSHHSADKAKTLANMLPDEKAVVK